MMDVAVKISKTREFFSFDVANVFRMYSFEISMSMPD